MNRNHIEFLMALKTHIAMAALLLVAPGCAARRRGPTGQTEHSRHSLR